MRLYMCADRMIEIAERCEAATGPDRELDEAIAKMRGWKREGFNLGKGIYDPNGNWHMHAPLFTASLDAAMSLVPEGCVSHERQYFGGVAYATIFTGGPWREIAKAKGKTKALALTAAALRARATQGEKQ